MPAVMTKHQEAKKRQRHHRHRPRIYVVVALVIFVIGILTSTASTVGVTLTSYAWSTDAMVATALGREKMEALKAQGYAALTSASSHIEGYDTMPYFPAYKRQTTVTVDSPAGGMKTVTVSVFWGADTHEVQLRLILAE